MVVVMGASLKAWVQQHRSGEGRRCEMIFKKARFRDEIVAAHIEGVARATNRHSSLLSSP